MKPNLGTPRSAPPGHPRGGAPPPEAPGSFVPPPDTVGPDPELPAGVLVAEIRTADGQPLAGTEVRLGVIHNTVAEGQRRASTTARTGADGNARFEGLARGSADSYRLTVARGAATYASNPFNLMTDSGYRARLHVYPVVRNIKQALVGMSGMLYIVPRDDNFHFEVLFRIFNAGSVTWVPENVSFRLPEGAKAFTAEESMNDTRAIEEDGSVRLEGTFTPGQHDVSYRFQLSRHNASDTEFVLGMPPHVAGMQVIAESSRGMSFDVEDFPEAQKTTSQGGQRVLATAKQLRRGDPELSQVSMAIRGLPTRGPGAVIASFIALLIAAMGLVFGGFAKGKGRPRIASDDVRTARRLLLDELVALERARQAEEIGQRIYETTRRALMQALTRIAVLAPPEAKKRPQRKKIATT